MSATIGSEGRLTVRESLNSVLGFVCRFVSLSDSQGRVVALWIAHTHAFSAADCTPYLSVTSAEKECGKTRLLEVGRHLVANPWFTGRVSAAVLTRKIDAQQPTLLLDESDTAFGGEREYAEALRGVLNTGYRQCGASSCCIGQGVNISYKDFSTFCPKAIAGIGKLPDTVASRSIPIRLKRAPRGTVPRFRERDANLEASPIAIRLAEWCTDNLDALRSARPDIPQELSDRQADVCEPLLAIADLAGGDWPKGAREAIIELCTEAQSSDDSIGVKLLGDIKAVFNHLHDDEPLPRIERIASCDLAEALGGAEDRPWAEWGRAQKPITQHQLAKQLAKYNIGPRTVRLPDGRRLKGYEREQFTEAWQLYLPQDSPQPPPTSDPKRDTVTTRENGGENGDSRSVTSVPRHGSENAENAGNNAPCHAVTPPNGGADSLICSRCGNQEQNLAAARYHFKRLCPVLGQEVTL